MILFPLIALTPSMGASVHQNMRVNRLGELTHVDTGRRKDLPCCHRSESEHLRALYLNQVCEDNTTLQARMQNLLIADQEDCSLLDSGVHAETRDSWQTASCLRYRGTRFLKRSVKAGWGLSISRNNYNPSTAR